MIAFIFVLALLNAVLRTGQPPSNPSLEARCPEFRKDIVCSESLGRWVRRMAIGLHMTESRTPTHVFDGFSSPRRTAQRSWSPSGLVGTRFVSGSLKGTLIDDRRHRLTFYGGGCCAYGTIVLSSGISPPPVRVMEADLRSVKTDTGLRLGDSPASVTAVYGAAPLRQDLAQPNVVYLLYRTTTPPHGPCVQDQTFGFTGGRLSYIEIWSGC
jgi:hypothetical protein